MGIQSSIDGLKRVALKQVIENIGSNIKSQHIINKLNDYIRYGSSTAFTLPSMFTPPNHTLYLSDISAKVLLSYLELYTQYIINASNSDTIVKLSDISNSKYQYVIFKYKELASVIVEKRKKKEYRYTQHIDFSAPSKIFGEAFTNSIFGLSNTLQLSYDNVLSLPILKSKYVYPNTLYSFISDNTISDFTYNSDNKNISSSIFRKYGNHIGSVKDINYITLTSPSASGSITFEGKLNGFISNTCYFKVLSYSLDSSNNIYSLTYQSSINAKDWDYSETIYTVNENTKYRIKVLGSVDTGIDFTILNKSLLSENIIWELVLDYIKLDYPQCNIKMVFNTLSPLSYIKYNDISEFSLTVSDNCYIKKEEMSASIDNIDVLSNSIQGIIPTNSQIYSIDIAFSQDKHKISSDSDGNMQLKFNYDIADITGYSNNYYKTGSIIFSPMQVEDISTICVESECVIPNKNIGEDVSRSNILYSILVENSYGIVEIPALRSKCFIDDTTLTSVEVSGGSNITRYYALEPLLLNQTTINNNIETYNLKFRFGATGTNSKFFLLNPYLSIDLNSPSLLTLEKTSTYTRALIDVTNHINRYYILKDVIDIGSMYNTNDTKLTLSNQKYWTTTINKCAYMFYFDNDGLVKVAIKQTDGDILIPFTGKLYGKVSMLSADDNYISPYITTYTLSAI
jgi:hypothetical protein